MAEDDHPGPLQYKELKQEKEIRLIELLPGDESAKIECSLAHVDLDEAQNNYVALSYVWGNASATKSICKQLQFPSHDESSFCSPPCSTFDNRRRDVSSLDRRNMHQSRRS